MKKPAFSEPIEIFRAGKQVDSAGVAREFTAADLAASVAAYDPKLSEAPIVVGHPKTNNPAYGWVEKLSVTDGVLQMHAHQVEPQFAEMVGAGRFKKRSASFYPPEHPSNPKPGIWYLRHVGWLGAEAPAVKGLKDVQFAADQAGVVNFDAGDRTIAGLFRSLRDFFIGEYGQDKADQVLPSWQVGSLEEYASMEEQLAAANTPQFSEVTPTTKKDTDMDKDQEIAAEKAKREQAEREAADMRAQLAQFNESQVRSRHAAHVSFAETQITAGRLLPKDKDALIATLDTLTAAKPVEFGEGDGKKTIDMGEWLKAQVANGKPVVSFGEHAPGRMDDTDVAPASDAELHDKATAYARQHNVSYSEAINKIATFTSV